MRLLFAGATGVLGRATLPHLGGHEVVALTRRADQVPLLRQLGAEPRVCDVYDAELLSEIARDVRPDAVVNFVTDLGAGSGAANNRIRREGASNLVRAATVAGASRLVVESVAFRLERDAADAVAALERSAEAFAGDAVIVRFGRLWGPGTFHETPPDPPAVCVVDAGRDAARLIVAAAPGTYVVA